MIVSAESLFVHGATYVVKHDAVCLRDTFLEGEALLYWRHGYSFYDGMHGWFFFDDDGKVRSWDESEPRDTSRDDLFVLSKPPSSLQQGCARNDAQGVRAAMAENPPGLGLRRIAFETACDNRAAECVQLLATSPEMTDDERRDFLHEAARRGAAACVGALLDAGIDVNLQDDYGQTALIFAAVEGSLETVEVLLSRSADRALATQAGNTAEILAVAFKKQAVVERLRRP